MTERNIVTILSNTMIQGLGNVWQSAKSYLTVEPPPLWQKAMEDQDYQVYRRFKTDLEHRTDIALRDIISPYAVIASYHTTISQKESINQLLHANPESALHYFYHDVMNQLVELSFDSKNIEAFEAMLAFYEPYVPEEIYQTVLKDCEVINKTNANLQSSIVDVTKKINQVFKPLQRNMNSEMETEQAAENFAGENHEPYHRLNFNQLIIMSAISLLANKNHLGLGLGLATAAFFAEPVNAAYPTVANPIPTQYAEPGQAFSYDIDLNQVFNDADGDIMTFGGATMADGSPLPAWVRVEPVLLGNYDTPGYVYDVTVQNGVAYVADGSSGIQLINISNLAAPSLLGNYTTTGLARGVTVQDGVAYVADDTSGIQLINVSNPATLSLLGNYDTPGSVDDLTVLNNVAYVADGSSGLQLINVSNSVVPKLLGNYTTSGFAWGVSVLNGVAYVVVGLSGLDLINVSNLAAPSLLGNYATPGNAWSVSVLNGVAYVVHFPSGLQLINVSNPAAPSPLGNYATPGGASGVSVLTGVAYVADYGSGLQLINVSNPAAPTLIGNYDTPGNAEDVTVLNSVAYVADGSFGLQFLDLRQTRLLGILPANATGMYNFSVHATNVNGEWVSTEMVLRITNLTQPSATLASSRTMPTTISVLFSPSTGIASSSSVTSTDSLSTVTSTPASQSSNPIRFTVTASSDPILIAGGSITLTANYLSVTGNVDPNQVVYTVQGNNPDIIITFNGVEVTQFTQGDVEGQFVSISLQGTGCQDYDNNLQLQASVAGSSTTVDFSLSVQVNTLSCNAGSRLADTAVLNIAALLTATDLGFWAPKREQRPALDAPHTVTDSHQFNPQFRR